MNERLGFRLSKQPRVRPAVMATCLAVAILIVLVSIAWATSVSNINGPNWNTGPQTWTLTGDVSYTGGDKTMCISGSFNSGANTYGPISCGTAASFTCTIPGGSVANATGAVTWVLNAWTGNNSCGGSQSANLANGTFAPNGTNANAITLSRFAAARDITGWQVAAVAVLGLLGLGAGLWWARSRRQAALPG